MSFDSRKTRDTAAAAVVNRELLTQWSRIDWAAITSDDAETSSSSSAAAAAPPAIDHHHSSLIAQLKEERRRQEEQEAAARGSEVFGGSNKRIWVDDDSAAKVPLQWPQNKRVGYVSGADKMTIFDEWYWLVFIGNNGMYAYERVMQGKATRRDNCGCMTPARFLNANKADVIDQQKDRLLKINNSGDANERARSRKQFEVMAPAFMRQPSNVFTVRVFSRDWCKGNMHVLQWLADHVGAPVALVHHGRGWVAEYLPCGSGECASLKYPPADISGETEAETMALHTWRPASNCIMLYAQYDSEAIGGMVFGVEFAPERVAQLPWFDLVVRLRSPYCVMTGANKYSIESMQLLDTRMAACRVAMRKCTTTTTTTTAQSSDNNGGGGKRVKKEEAAAAAAAAPEEEAPEERPMRRHALFKKIATALTAF